SLVLVPWPPPDRFLHLQLQQRGRDLWNAQTQLLGHFVDVPRPILKEFANPALGLIQLCRRLRSYRLRGTLDPFQLFQDVLPPAWRAARWAIPSMPRARPLTTVKPARTRSPAKRSATRRP